MDLGATVCLARVPRCEACPLAGDCPSRGTRDEPLRKQSAFEGSFRQRRADDAPARRCDAGADAARGARPRGRGVARARRPRGAAGGRQRQPAVAVPAPGAAPAVPGRLRTNAALATQMRGSGANVPQGLLEPFYNGSQRPVTYSLRDVCRVPRRRTTCAGGARSAGPVVHPDVRLDVDSSIRRQIHLDRLERTRHDVRPVAGNRIPVHSSQSAMVPGMIIDSAQTFSIVAPARACTRSHGSNGSPSSVVQVMYSPIGVSG